MLWGFPGETAAEYDEQAALFPQLTHLPPPNGGGRIWMERFSPIFSQSEARDPWVRAFVEWDIVSWDPAWGWDDIDADSAELDAVFLGGEGAKQRQAPSG